MAKKQPITDISNNELLNLIVNQLENKSNDYYKEFDDIKGTLKELNTKVGIQNGRVTMLEHRHNECKIDEVTEQTEILRMFYKHPKLTGVFLALIAVIISGGTIVSLLKLFV
jgi:hypothetical protein